MTADNRAIILRIVDHKPGHEQQSLGLANALTLLLNAKVATIDYFTLSTCCSMLAGRLPTALRELPLSNIVCVIGAGHRTHLSLIMLKYVLKLRTIVLMKPSFPYAWFDQCVIPRHDGVINHPHCLMSEGVLNAVVPRRKVKQNIALILIGGISKHFAWDTQQVLSQIAVWITHYAPHYEIYLTTSRRTPTDFIDQLKDKHLPIQIMAYENAPPEWLKRQLAVAKHALISEDSVSMLYEALTAQLSVDLLRLPQGQGRVMLNNQYLLKQEWLGQVTCDGDYHKIIDTSKSSLNESERIAQQIMQRFFQMPVKH